MQTERAVVFRSKTSRNMQIENGDDLPPLVAVPPLQVLLPPRIVVHDAPRPEGAEGLSPGVFNRGRKSPNERAVLKGRQIKSR